MNAPRRPTKSSSRTTATTTADDARSITKSLRRSQKLLQHELERVSHVSQAIQDDGRVLGATKAHHLEMVDSVKDARGALRGLQLQQQKERLILLLAVAFYALAVVYVLWTRIPLFGIDYLVGKAWKGVRMGVTLFWNSMGELAVDFREKNRN